MSVEIAKDTFGRRVKLLYDAWKAHRSDLWDNANILAVLVGGTSDDLRYLKSISLHLWLFGYELPDTLMVFMDASLHIMTSSKKAALLEPLADELQSATGAQLKLIVRTKGQEEQQLQSLMKSVKSVHDGRLGVLPKENHSGPLADMWAAQLQASGLETADATAGFADLFSVKEEGEVLNAKKAAFLASKVMQGYVVEKIEDIIDKSKKVKHSKLSEMTEEVILNPPQIGVKLKPDNVDIAYPPLFQSGGHYDLKLSAACDDQNLHDGVIIVSLGTRYQSYCANVSRTYIINPNKAQEAQYNALLAAHEAACAALKDGQPAKASMEAAIRALQDKGQPELVEKLNKNVGFGMGLEFREGANVLNAKNDKPLRAGQVFTVSLGVAGLQVADAADPRAQTYALQIADTVVVKAGGVPPENLCTAATKAWDKVSYTLNDDQEEDGIDALEEVTNGNVMPGGKKLRSDDPNFKSNEQIRREKQEDLLKQKNEETLRRLTAQAAGAGNGGHDASKGRLISQVQSYRGVGDLPNLSANQVHVDQRAETILVPIYGVMVPVHITMVRSVNQTAEQESNGAIIRLSLNFGTSFEPAQKFPQLAFLKELSFRTGDAKHAQRVVADIKVLRNNVIQRDRERAERATLVAQEKLIRGKRVFRLPDLWVRPGLGGKGRKMPGALEAHHNGFRYSNPKGEGLDVMYRNIRYAFFQPAENDMITILHFHLINPIMIGNKKTKDVQFYCEVVDQIQTLDGGRRNMYDPDEIEEEQREREKRNKINQDFNQFVRRVQEHWEREFPDLQLEFDIPFRELGFEGVPHRETVLVLPTVNCLVELTQMPFTVVSLSDIEIINLERVGFNLKNFDMAIVFKDFNRDVLRIDAIPSKKLDTIKEWLTSVKIKYYESKMNLAWKPILKHILEDPQAFIDEGGWAFLDLEKSDAEDEDEEQSSEGFNPGSDAEEEEEESSEDYSDEDASVVDSEEADEGVSEEEEESEGMTWEELEEEAKREDKRRAEQDDSDDERPRKKGKPSAGGAGAPGAKRRR